ncbi:MAG: hypothetical protein JRD04_11070 [Deltaproteobacteria bacterium]|nr:hypothetical protein [Deltaproteobacteria bacterium]
MDYTEFKTYLLTFLWKQNDGDLVANLDNLISMANAELRRALSLNGQTSVANIPVIDNVITLPTAHVTIDAVGVVGGGVLFSGTPAQMVESATSGGNYGEDGLYFVQGNSIVVLGNIDPANPQELAVIYREAVPDFKADDASWVADEYLDLYVYAVLKHTAPFLREDERVALWIAMYDSALQSVREDEAFHKNLAGSPLAGWQARTAP